MRAAALPARLRAFFEVQIWDAQLAELPPGRALLYRLARIASSAVRGFLENDIPLRAAALTYYSVLSIVPFLAFAFAMLKGFGAYRTFVEAMIRPYVQQTFAGNAPLHDAIERILRFVDQTDVSKLGAVGLLALAYTSVTLVASVEAALNQLFGARSRRPLVRQVTDYVTLLVTTPILLLAGASATTAAQNSRFVEFLRVTLGLGPVIDTLLGFTSTFVVGVALFAMYEILPNVRVRPLPALAGAAVSAVLWQAALVLQIQLQMGVARYSALYSVLGAIPIFFVWTYASWLIILVGGQLAAAYQNEPIARQRFHAAQLDQRSRETLAVGAAARIVRAFLARGPRPTKESLAAALEVPPLALEPVLEALVRAGILAPTVAGGEQAYVPGRDVDATHLADVLAALRRDPRAEGDAVELQLGPGLQGIVRELDVAVYSSPANMTLRALAGAVAEGEGRPPPAAIARAKGRAAGDGQRPIDPKQPGVPP